MFTCTALQKVLLSNYNLEALDEYYLTINNFITYLSLHKKSLKFISYRAQALSTRRVLMCTLADYI